MSTNDLVYFNRGEVVPGVVGTPTTHGLDYFDRGEAYLFETEPLGVVQSITPTGSISPTGILTTSVIVPIAAVAVSAEGPTPVWKAGIWGRKTWILIDEAGLPLPLKVNNAGTTLARRGIRLPTRITVDYATSGTVIGPVGLAMGSDNMLRPLGIR